MGVVPQVTQKDLDAAQGSLSKQLQNSFMIWLKSQLTPGDVAGMPDTTEKLTMQAGQQLPMGTNTFSLGLTATYTVLLLSHSDLQAATYAQLVELLGQDKAFSAYIVANNVPITITNMTIKKKGHNQQLLFTATGQIVPSIPAEGAANEVSGKTIAEAQSTLQTKIERITHSQRMKITIQTAPYQLIFMPKSGNIHLYFDALLVTSPGDSRKNQ